MRTRSSIINIITAWCGQFLLVFCQIANRYVFVRTLSAEYLGVSSLFSNILSVLALSEMGIGTALAFSLYLPLAKHDTDKIKSLMRLYRDAYRIIGFAVIILGLALIPFYPNLISSTPDIPDLDLIFLLFVVNSGLSYFFSYKASLICCDQKNYIHSIIHYGAVVILNLVQILILYTFHDYVLYVVIQLLFTLIQNIILSLVADKLYPYLREKNVEPLNRDDKKLIRRNIGALFFHKMGDRVTNSVVTILISYFINLSVVGIYTNYKYISDSLSMIISQAFSSITGSVGNLEAAEQPDKVYLVFRKIFFLNYFLIGFCSICLVCLFQPFIRLWVGDSYLMSNVIMIAFVIQFYISGMRQTVLVFRDASASYYYDRYKPLFSMAYCFIATFILIMDYGVLGVIMASITCNLFIDTIVETIMLYRHVFFEKARWYFKRYMIYACLTILDGIFAYNFISSIPLAGVWGFIAKMFASVIVAFALLILSSFFFDEFKSWWNIFRGYVVYFIRRTCKTFSH